MGFVDAFEVHEEDARSDSVDVVLLGYQLVDVFLGDLPVFYVAEGVLCLHDGFYCLLTDCVVVVLQEGSKDFVVELSVLVEGQILEETDQGLGN